jgi:hypothetical protein
MKSVCTHYSCTTFRDAVAGMRGFVCTKKEEKNEEKMPGQASVSNKKRIRPTHSEDRTVRQTPNILHPA